MKKIITRSQNLRNMISILFFFVCAVHSFGQNNSLWDYERAYGETKEQFKTVILNKKLWSDASKELENLLSDLEEDKTETSYFDEKEILKLKQIESDLKIIKHIGDCFHLEEHYFNYDIVSKFIRIFPLAKWAFESSYTNEANIYSLSLNGLTVYCSIHNKEAVYTVHFYNGNSCDIISGEYTSCPGMYHAFINNAKCLNSKLPVKITGLKFKMNDDFGICKSYN